MARDSARRPAKSSIRKLPRSPLGTCKRQIRTEIYGDFPEKLDCVQRVSLPFSGSDIWVQFSDLPEATSNGLGKGSRQAIFDESSRGQDQSRAAIDAFAGIRQQVALALRCFLETTYMEIEECSGFPIGESSS